MSKSRPALAILALTAALCPGLRAGIVPRPAPDFKINLTNGRQIALREFKGHTLALIFILTYCPHCQKMVGFLSQDQRDYSPRGFQVLGTAIEDGAAAAIPGFFKKFSPPFPIGANPRETVLDFLQHPVAERMSMPELVFIDREGIIRGQYSGESSFLDEAQAEKNLRMKIEELLK